MRATLFVLLLLAVYAAAYMPPKVFSTGSKRKLDIVMVALPTPALLNFPQLPNASAESVTWQYHACARTSAKQLACPPRTFNKFGIVLQLQPGDQVKIRLVNRLPIWRTNLHFHGLAVSTKYNNVTFADYSFVTAYNSQVEHNVEPVELPIILQKDYIDYQFQIPNKHPKGMFWFHPHNHQMANGTMNEGNADMINAGLSGALVIGKLQSYVSNIAKTPQSYLVLRSTYFNQFGVLQPNALPWFCNNATVPLPGYCLGANGTGVTYFTLNNQVYPHLVVPKRTGVIWRLVQSLSSANLVVSLVNDDDGMPIPFRVLWSDGIALQTASLNGNLVNSFFFMPGSRVDLFIPSASVNMRAKLVGTGPPLGTDPTTLFPSVLLASVQFQSGGTKPNPKVPVAQSSGSVWNAMETPPRTDITCNDTYALAQGHRRVITFGRYPNNTSEFALAYHEVDDKGIMVRGSETPMQMFDPQDITVCAKLGATEVWEIANPTDEDHNFHIHQTKFQILGANVTIRPGYVFPTDAVDSVPMAPYSVTVISIPFVRSGDFPYHCHLTRHSDRGMMARIRVAEKMKGD